MKVVYIISTLERSGPVNILFSLVKNINKTQFTPVILTLSPESLNSRKYDFECLGVKVYSLNISRLKGLIMGIKLLKDKLIEISPDIIHTHGFRADILSGFFLPKYNRVNTLHNNPIKDYVMTYKKILGLPMAYLSLKSYENINIPIACSTTIQSELKDNLKKEIKVVHNGVDLTKININNRSKLRKQLNIPENETVFIYVGVMNERKDPFTILEGFCYLRKKTKNITLIMVGNGPLLDECMEKYNNNNIIFTGNISNPKDYFQISDYYISASHAEGFPTATLEALSLGLPLILSDIGPHVELLVESDREIGITFQKSNYKHMAEKVMEILKKDKETLKNNALNIIINKFNSLKMTKEYEKIYKLFLKERI